MDKEDVVYIHSGILVGDEKELNLDIVTTWMELEGIMLSKISQSEGQISYDFTRMWNLRNSIDEHRGREGKIRKKRDGGKP